MGVAVLWTQALEAETQGFRVILDFVIARLRQPCRTHRHGTDETGSAHGNSAQLFR
jgi:hypothetical protein